jgi:nitrous oxidase accessory protein
VRLYADKLWQFDHHLRFFFATPLLGLLDFMERIAPFSEPIELLRDPLPRISAADDPSASGSAEVHTSAFQ